MVSDDSRRLERRFLFWTLAFFAVLSLLVLQEFFWYISTGALLVFAFFPMHRRIRHGLKRPWVAAMASFLIVALAVVGPLVLVGVLVFHDAVAFAQDYDSDKLNDTIQSALEPFGISGSGENDSASKPSAAAAWLGGVTQRFASEVVVVLVDALPGLVIGLIMTGFTIYYGFLDGESFHGHLRHAMPLPDDIEDRLFSELSRVTKIVFLGNILTSALAGLVGGISFFLFGVPNAVFWGFVMMIFGILPVVGTPLIWIPATAWLALSGNLVGAVAVLLINGLLVTGYVDYILRPKLIGKAANIHPILVLVGVLGGVGVLGPLGFVLGPLVLAITIVLIRSYTEWHPRWRERRAQRLEPYAPRPPEGEGAEADRQAPTDVGPPKG